MHKVSLEFRGDREHLEIKDTRDQEVWMVVMEQMVPWDHLDIQEIRDLVDLRERMVQPDPVETQVRVESIRRERKVIQVTRVGVGQTVKWDFLVMSATLVHKDHAEKEYVQIQQLELTFIHNGY